MKKIVSMSDAPVTKVEVTDYQVRDFIDVHPDAALGLVDRKALKGRIRIHPDGFGFVGDVYVPPRLASAFMDGEEVAVHCVDTPRGRRADRVRQWDEWRHLNADVLERAVKRRLEWEELERRGDRSREWADAHAKVSRAAPGLVLIRLEEEVRHDYGGYIRRRIVVTGQVDRARAEALADAFGRGDMSPVEGPVAQPYESVRFGECPDGAEVVYEWRGSWTD